MCLSGCLTAYRRHVLIELEPILENRNILGVPIKYGEDRFLTRQIVKAGYRTVHDDGRDVLHQGGDRRCSGYFTQQLRWKRSNIVDFIGRPRRTRGGSTRCCASSTSRCSCCSWSTRSSSSRTSLEGRVLRARDVPPRRDRVLRVLYHFSPSTRALPPWLRVASDRVPADGRADAGRVPAAHAARSVHARQLELGDPRPRRQRRAREGAAVIVAAHQPHYLPWLGYLDKIAQADLFVVMDDLQYETQNFQNRNRIKLNDGPPGSPSRSSAARRAIASATSGSTTTASAARQHWQRRTWATLADPLRPGAALRALRRRSSRTCSRAAWDRLLDLDLHMLDLARGWLGITRPIVRVVLARSRRRRRPTASSTCAAKVGAEGLPLGPRRLDRLPRRRRAPRRPASRSSGSASSTRSTRSATPGSASSRTSASSTCSSTAAPRAATSCRRPASAASPEGPTP